MGPARDPSRVVITPFVNTHVPGEVAGIVVADRCDSENGAVFREGHRPAREVAGRLTVDVGAELDPGWCWSL